VLVSLYFYDKECDKNFAIKLTKGLTRQASLIYKKKTRIWQSQICPYLQGFFL
jgi:hypothetical protein